MSETGYSVDDAHQWLDQLYANLCKDEAYRGHTQWEDIHGRMRWEISILNPYLKTLVNYALERWQSSADGTKLYWVTWLLQEFPGQEMS